MPAGGVKGKASARPRRAELRRLFLKRIREIAETRAPYGYRSITVLMRREGWPVNHKRVHRFKAHSMPTRRACADPERVLTAIKRGKQAWESVHY